MIRVYEIALENQIGFGYVKVIQEPKTGNVIFQIINFFSEHPILELDNPALQSEYLVAPSLSKMLPPKQGNKIWRRLFDSKIADRDIPLAFKFEPTTKNWDSKDWETLTWYSFDNFNVQALDIYSYRQVAHLPLWIHFHPDFFVTRLTMVWLKKMNRNIEAYYDLPTLSWQQKAIYFEVSNGVFYNEIPKELRSIPIGIPLTK